MYLRLTRIYVPAAVHQRIIKRNKVTFNRKSWSQLFILLFVHWKAAELLILIHFFTAALCSGCFLEECRISSTAAVICRSALTPGLHSPLPSCYSQKRVEHAGAKTDNKPSPPEVLFQCPCLRMKVFSCCSVSTGGVLTRALLPIKKQLTHTLNLWKSWTL